MTGSSLKSENTCVIWKRAGLVSRRKMRSTLLVIRLSPPWLVSLFCVHTLQSKSLIALASTGKVLAECPWYFEIKAILDEARHGPPGGFPVGNSRTPIDESVLLRKIGRANTRQRHENHDEEEEEEEGDQNSDSDEDDSDEDRSRRYYEEVKRQERALKEEHRQMRVERARFIAEAEVKLQRQRVRYMVREAKLRYDLDMQLHRERRAALGAVYKMYPYQPHPEVEYFVPPAFVDPSLGMEQR